MEKWNELCFILSESINQNLSEQLYELKVIQAFEKLEWSQFRKEISVQENIQYGSTNRIYPDLILKNHNNIPQLVIEIKRPSEDLDNQSYINQLDTYMRMLRLDIGVLIGNKIRIFVSGRYLNQNEPILIDDIDFSRNNELGLKFTQVFNKNIFSKDHLKDYIDEKLNKIRSIQDVKRLKEEILSPLFKTDLKEIINQHFIQKYTPLTIEKVMDEIEISIHDKLYSKPIHISQPYASSNSINSSQPRTRIVRTNEEEIERIKRKIPKWFNNLNQKNSKILIIYLELLELKQAVEYSTLESKCSHINKFKSNFQQMKIISAQNHAKVFEEVGALVTLWNPVKEFILSEYNKFKLSNVNFDNSPLNSFSINLGKKYYNEGFFNTGVEYSKLFGNDKDDIKIQLGDDVNRYTLGHINRTANSNGSPRIFGGRELKNWIQTELKFGEEFNVKVINPTFIKVTSN